MSAVDISARGLAAQTGPRSLAAVRLAQLKALRFGGLPAVSGVPPRISLATAPQLSTSGDGIVGKDDARAPYAHGVVATRIGGYPSNLVNTGQWISYSDGTKGANVISRRFETDAPQVEFLFGDFGGGPSLYLEVDGQPVALSPTVAFGNSGNLYYVLLDFGANAQTIKPALAIAAGGSGYAVGDSFAVVGGTGGALTGVVTQVSSGAVARYYLTGYGSYTALPGAAAATTTSGSGTGFTVTLTDTAQGTKLTGQTVRRFRRIEMFADLGKFGEIRVPLYSTVRPWPVAGPRLMVMQDSYGATFADYAGGAWAWRMARRLGIEDIWTNSVGGTGFVNFGAPNYAYQGRLADIAANLPSDPGVPAIHLCQGSINDRNAGGLAGLQAAAQSYWVQAFATMPNAYHIQTGIFIGTADGSQDPYNPLLRAGFLAARAIYDPQGKRSAFIETQGTGNLLLTGSGKAGGPNGSGNTDFWIAGDGAHPTQDGHNYIGDWMAMAVLGAIRTMG